MQVIAFLLQDQCSFNIHNIQLKKYLFTKTTASCFLLSSFVYFNGNSPALSPIPGSICNVDLSKVWPLVPTNGITENSSLSYWKKKLYKVFVPCKKAMSENFMKCLANKYRS